MAGLVDLRPGSDGEPGMRRLLIGRAAKLEQLGLACPRRSCSLDH
jgi:hypothetical protein